MLAVALEATSACAPRRSGIGRFVVQLIDALARRGDVDLTLLYRLSRIKRASLRHAPSGTRTAWLHEPWLPLFGRTPLVHGLDVRVPDWRGAVQVGTLHDLFAHISAEFTSESLGEKIRARYRVLAERADWVVADSEATRRDFLERYDADPERVGVIWLGVEERFRPEAAAELQPLRASLGLPEDYLLYVGHLSKRKNVPRMLEAYARSAARGSLPFVLAGAAESGSDDVQRAIAELGLEGDVVRLGFTEDALLPALYAGARAFCFPTLYEGFGIPILEAMRSGTPVVVADRGSAPEVAAGHAATCDPTSVESIAAALDRALAVGPEAVEAAEAHARACTWRRTADRYVELWSRLLEERGR